MLNNFTLIQDLETQKIEARNICNYTYNHILYFKEDKLMLDTFINRIVALATDGVTECSIIKFKLKERGIF